jgi:hypothetical protein
MTRLLTLCLLLGITQSAAAQITPVQTTPAHTTLREQNELLFEQLQQVHGLTDEQMRNIRAIFAHSPVLGQGNPAISQHPVTPQQCAVKLEQAKVNYDNAQFQQICGRKYMAPLYDPKSARADQATACIDQFEFPDIPCAYPVVWVKAREAAQICAGGR